MRLLKWLENGPVPDVRNYGSGGTDAEKLAGKIVRCLAPPYLQNHVNALKEDCIPVLLIIAKYFSVRHQASRAYSHNKSPFENVVQHRNLGSDSCWMGVWHIDGAAT